MRTENYTAPRIYRGAKEWFVEYFYRNPYSEVEKWDRFRIRGKMNYEHNLEKREKLAQLLQAGLLRGLKAGKMPTRYVTLKRTTRPLFDKLTALARSEGLGKSLDTKNAYLLMIGRLKKYFAFIGVGDPALEEFTQDRAQEFKEFLMEEMELKNVTVNTTIQPLKMFFKQLVAKREIEAQPFEFVKYLPKHRGSTFIAFDQEEKKLISEHLREKNYMLYLFSNFIYSCFMRPKEICALTPKDIDLSRGFIQVRVETSKVSHTSHRQILPGLRKLIVESGICGFASNEPIFQSICGTESNLRLRRRRVTELWRNTVKDQLKIEKEMYGLKHTGNIDYLKSLDAIENANLMWMKQQNDHTTLETTQRYIEDLGIYKMKYEKLQFGLL